MKTSIHVLLRAIALLSLTVAALLIGCDNDEAIQSHGYSIGQRSPTAAQMNAARERFTQALAKSMADVDVKTFIKTKILNRNTPEYDIHYVQIRDQMVTGNATFAQVMQRYDGASGTFFADSLEYYDPFATIIIADLEAAEPEDWDLADTPKVYFVNETFNEGHDIKVYSSNGTSQIVSSSTIPNVTTLAVKASESFIPVNSSDYTPGGFYVDPDLDLNPVFTGDFYVFVDLEAFTDSVFVRSDPPTGPPPTGVDCDRDDRDEKEEFVKLKFVNESAFKQVVGFLDNRPEIEPHFIAVTSPSNPQITDLKKMIRDKRKDFFENNQTKWYNYYSQNNARLLWLKWSEATFGDHTKWIWIEKDKADFSADLSVKTPKIKFDSVELAEISFTIKWNPKDDEIYEDAPEYCEEADGEGEQYNTGLMLFHIKEKE